MLWSIADIADAIEYGLSRRLAELDLAQEVRGIDALDEVGLHPLIEEALRISGYGVHREERFPADRVKRKKSEGRRCDIVLTPAGRPLLHPDADATLFMNEDAIELADAFWLEVKVVAQFTEEGPNGRYSAELLEPVRRDVAKLSRDEGILHAAILLVLFVAERSVAVHDLAQWQSKCLDKGYPIGSPSVRHLALADRLGHSCCTIAVFPVYHL